MAEQTWSEWLCAGSSWLPCGTWDEDGGWSAEHAGSWAGEGAELAAGTVGDGIEAVLEASPTLSGALEATGDALEGAGKVASTLTTIALIGVIGYGLSQVRGLLR